MLSRFLTVAWIYLQSLSDFEQSRKLFFHFLCFSFAFPFLQNVSSRWIIFTFHFFLVLNECHLDKIRLSEFSMKRWLVEGSLVFFSYSFSINLTRQTLYEEGEDSTHTWGETKSDLLSPGRIKKTVLESVCWWGTPLAPLREGCK